jgi:hypothetical protein
MAIKKGQDKDVERRQEKATNKGIYKGAQKIDTAFSATPTFITPHVPSTPASIPTSTSGDDNKLRSTDVKCLPTENTNADNTTTMMLMPISHGTKAYAMFGTPSAYRKERSVVTPYIHETLFVFLPETMSVYGESLLAMRYLRLNEGEQNIISEIFSRRESVNDVIIDRFSIKITKDYFSH